MENLDLLFAQVRNISFHQQQMAAQFDINTKIVEQLLLDQRMLSQQIEATVQAVANLTLNRQCPSSPPSEPVSPRPRRSAAGTSRFPSHHNVAGFARHFHDGEGPIRAVIEIVISTL